MRPFLKKTHSVLQKSGRIYVYSAQNYTSAPVYSHEFSLFVNGPPESSKENELGDMYAPKRMAWTSDGYALAVGFQHRGLAVWSVYGHLLSSISDQDDVLYGRHDVDGSK